IQDFNRVDPAWAATLRPSRIPTIKGLHGSDGESLVSARQSRFGVKANLPSSVGSVRTMLEIDLFGVGPDEGETTLRLRHAYGEYKTLLGGQTHSLFMDINVFPNVIDYWGPAGMVFLRNPQLRWTPIRGTHTVAVAIEQPSSDIDVGTFDRVIEALALDIRGVNRLPNVTWRYRLEHERLHFQVAGIFRDIGFETIKLPPPPGNDPKDQIFGWGVNLSSVITVHDRDRIIMSYVFGEGIASYMNDGGVDLAPSLAFPNLGKPQAVPLRGLVLYYDHYWCDQWSTSAGYSSTEVDNLDGQNGNAFRRGQYASANLLHYPADSVMYGVEYLWGKRTDKDGRSGFDHRMQVSFKYSF
ncbi:MAG: DcaP family trimeric outer membrane transporter, partial [Rubripirellula sp.]